MSGTICITTRHEFQARQVEHTLRKGYPQYRTERDGRSVTTQAPSATVREAADALRIAEDSRWIVVVMSDVKIGQISVTLREPPANTARVACGHVVCDVGYAAGYRFFVELTKIREALVAAHAVLTERDDARGGAPREPPRRPGGRAVTREEADRLVAELEALPPYRGWWFAHEYPGLFCYHQADGPLSVFFTPDWSGDGELQVEVQTADGRCLDCQVLPLPPGGRTGEKISAMVRPTLDGLREVASANTEGTR